MRLKMRFVLFGLLLLVGREMRADSIIPSNTRFNLLLEQNVAIPGRPLILFERLNEDDHYSLSRFGYEWARLIADGDTIPLKLIDSCAGKSFTQWLFEPEPEGRMEYGKQNFFCIYFGRYDRLNGTSANCFIINNPIEDCGTRTKGEINGIPELLETQDSSYFPAKKVLLRINAYDENAMLLKAVYTDRVTGEKHKRYFQLESAESDTGLVIDIGLADLISTVNYSLEITLINLYGDQLGSIMLNEDVRFKKGSRYVYSEEKQKQPEEISSVFIGLFFIVAFSALFIAVKR